MRALWAGPGAMRALRDGGDGFVEVALGAGGYMRLGADGWLLLATPRAVMGPLTLGVSGLEGVQAEAGWPARVEGDVLVVGPHRIALPRAVERAKPRPRRPGPGVVELLHALAAGDPLLPPLAPGVRALAARDHAQAVALLAGRGPGLTPAGDDVLAGYAGFMAAAGAPVELAALAADRSPPIALAYLRCAERGELPEPAVRLLDAVGEGDPIGAARRARVLRRSWGASSGHALLCGFAAAASHASSSGFASASSSASFAPSPIWVGGASRRRRASSSPAA